jgi:hypothetical protein
LGKVQCQIEIAKITFHLLVHRFALFRSCAKPHADGFIEWSGNIERTGAHIIVVFFLEGFYCALVGVVSLDLDHLATISDRRAL